MFRMLTTSIFVAFICVTSYGQSDQEYSKVLMKMFEVSGTEETYQSAITQMFSLFKRQYENVDESVWEELEKEFTGTSLDELQVMLMPVYQKYMTKEDLEELIKFYESPVGKKYAKNTPFIMQESMQLGQQWGMKIGEEFVKKMEERGY